MFKLDLYLFCLLVYLKHSGDVLRKNYKCQSCIHPRISKPEEIPPFDVRRHLVPNIHGIVIYIYIYIYISDFVFSQKMVLLPKRVADG